MKKIIWIASYPKSGSTWVRAIVSALLYSSEGRFNFKLLKLIELFEKKNRFNFVENLNNTDSKRLDKIECISKYWKICQEKIVFDKSINPIFNIFKTHSANLAINSNNFTNSDLTEAVIYIVRDPREIVISFSKHLGKSVDHTIETITDTSRLLTSNEKLTTTILSSWEIHIESWKRLGVPITFIKYEDLILEGKNHIIQISDFLSKYLDINKNNLVHKIQNTFNSTRISEFREYEDKIGFDEASKHSNFFGDAQVNTWEKKLTKEQIYKIEHKFNKKMKELGYLK